MNEVIGFAIVSSKGNIVMEDYLEGDLLLIYTTEEAARENCRDSVLGETVQRVVVTKALERED